MKLAVVTASVDPTSTRPYWQSWWETSVNPFDCYWTFNPSDPKDLGGFMGWFMERAAKLNGDPTIHIAMQNGIGGVVPMFAKGVKAAWEAGAELIACLHDDVKIETTGWDVLVKGFFDKHPKCILAGFGGAKWLGQPNMYEIPYDPMTLARHHFISNMVGGEVHGSLSTSPEKVVVLDGFSLIGRAEFFHKAWEWLHRSGIIHHAYDAAMGCLAARERGEVWMLPVKVHHHGGMTAVGNAKYQEWAMTQHPRGDAAFWEMAHHIVYNEFKDVLPLGY